MLKTWLISSRSQLDIVTNEVDDEARDKYSNSRSTDSGRSTEKLTKPKKLQKFKDQKLSDI